jgi:CBS domain containing-hemolysin-like protein
MHSSMILMSALLATLLLIATFAFFVIAVTAYVTVIWRKRSPVSYFDLSVLGKQ